MPVLLNQAAVKAIAIRAFVSAAKMSACFRMPMVRIPWALAAVGQQTLPVRPVALTTNGMPSF